MGHTCGCAGRGDSPPSDAPARGTWGWRRTLLTLPPTKRPPPSTPFLQVRRRGASLPWPRHPPSTPTATRPTRRAPALGTILSGAAGQAHFTDGEPGAQGGGGELPEAKSSSPTPCRFLAAGLIPHTQKAEVGAAPTTPSSRGGPRNSRWPGQTCSVRLGSQHLFRDHRGHRHTRGRPSCSKGPSGARCAPPPPCSAPPPQGTQLCPQVPSTCTPCAPSRARSSVSVWLSSPRPPCSGRRTLRAGPVTESSWGSLHNPTQKQEGTRWQNPEKCTCKPRTLPPASLPALPRPHGFAGPALCMGQSAPPSPIRPWSCQSCHHPSLSDPLQACGGGGVHSCRAGTELPFSPGLAPAPGASSLHPEAGQRMGLRLSLSRGPGLRASGT